ncbi:hypothetical protein [Leeuwenhoekiella sp. MAR_2009_132]|uniref:hypothetical protein n=1 Tax=Leeuwenhoekiella sp. MAR_2009_132 TaxID=1392489 RepID=UPI00048BCF60|nr:hypothetical protein [Leeuwenhoekiella sp. MAR_2009_132]
MYRRTFKFSKLLFLLGAVSASLTYCKNNTEDKAKIDEVIEYKDVEQTSSAKDSKLYSLTTSCPDMINAIDFSTLCFTDEKNPPYTTGDMSSMNNRCQITLADGALELGILFKDYSGLNSEEIQMRNEAEKQAFMQMNKMEFKNAKSIKNLGDYAILNEAYLNDPDLKRLSIRLNNISIVIESNKNFCAGSDEELEKMGKLVLASITN